MRARFSGIGVLPALFFLLSACSAPKYDTSNPLGKEAIMYSVDLALTSEDCTSAINLIQPLYASALTDNNVRLLTASAYGCRSGINFFRLLGDISANPSKLVNNQFWAFITQEFPSANGDGKAEAASLAIDALLATFSPGTLVNPTNQINPGTPNVGSTLVSDRTIDSNEYLSFTTIAAMGTIQNRYGNPNASYVKQTNLPWNTAVKLTSDGCDYASAVVNFADSLDAIANNSTGPLHNTMMAVRLAFQAKIFNACNLGCTNANPGGGWVQSGCTVTTACASCPLALRDRSKCTAQATDQVSCAAAGIVNFINTDTSFGWN